MQDCQSIPDAAEANGLSPSTGAACRLLIIDDDLSVTTLIAKFGERLGFSATSAATFDAARQLLVSCQFDCITLDLNIGKENGIGIMKVLSEIGSKTPIILISGSAPSDSELAVAVGNMMQLNLLPSLPKPVDFAKLKAALTGIRQELDRRRNAA